MKRKLFYLMMVGMICLFSSQAFAGVYADDLSRCLIESSTPADKHVLVKWMFTSMSFHPAVKPLMSFSEEQIDKSNKDMAEVMTKFFTKTCKAQASKAIKYEGEAAIHAGFSVFGQVVSRELFADPDVARGLSGLTKYIDGEKIEKELGLSKTLK